MGWLAIDPGTKMAWAFYNKGDAAVQFGTWSLGKTNASKGDRYFSFMKKLIEFYNDHEVSGIAIEEPAYSRNNSGSSRSMSEAWIPILTMFCSMKGLPEPAIVASTSWRKSFIGYGQLSKETKAKLVRSTKTKTYDAHRKHWKSLAIERCRERGNDPQNDDEADAIGILYWAHNGGHDVKKQAMAMKRLKSLEKRRQTMMDLSAPE